MVAAMLEEAPSILCNNRRDRYPWRFNQGFAGSGLCFSATLIFENASSIQHFAAIVNHAATMCLWMLVNRSPAERQEHDKRHDRPSKATFGQRHCNPLQWDLSWARLPYLWGE